MVVVLVLRGVAGAKPPLAPDKSQPSNPVMPLDLKVRGGGEDFKGYKK